MEENYYEILEVNKNASPEIIEKAYKTLVKKYHPDLQEDNMKKIYEEKIKKINEAYDILSNSEERKNYDLNLNNTIISSDDYNNLINENINLKKEINYLKNNTINENELNYNKNNYNIQNNINENIINEKRMTNIINRMKELTSSFNNEKKAYIHADMHPKNIMIDNKKNLYIIDIESFCIDYFVMNVRWSIIAAFRNKENNEFFKGFINGYYDNNIPDSFNKQLIFITILNFLEHTIEFSKTKDKEFIIAYASKINLLFNSVDLFSDNNILDNTTIFNK